VTSRRPPPQGKVWQRFRSVTAFAITASQVPDYIAAYVTPDRRAELSQRIDPLVGGSQSFSPLFLRFAIEQALAGAVTSTSTLNLVLQYLEELRAGKIDLSVDDMLRAASVAAREAVRESLVPREIEQSFLRGVLVKEADSLAFMTAKNDNAVDPAAVIDMLVQCGVSQCHGTEPKKRRETHRWDTNFHEPASSEMAYCPSTWHSRAAFQAKWLLLTLKPAVLRSEAPRRSSPKAPIGCAGAHLKLGPGERAISARKSRWQIVR